MAVRLPAWLILLAALALAARLPAGRAQQAEVDQEYLLKAAYLRTFGLYTVWPPAGVPDKQFVIGILGKNSFGNVTKEMEKLQIDKRPVVVKEFKSMKDYQPCHVLFIGKDPADPNAKETPADRLAMAQKDLNKLPVLLVGDSPGLAAKGAMLNLYLEKNKVLFEINVERFKAVGLLPKADLQKYGKAVAPETK